MSFEIDKALALGIDDTNDIISQNMQMYLLAERLRRVKDAPLSEEIHELQREHLLVGREQGDHLLLLSVQSQCVQP